MAQYISKSALVAEIERLKERFIAFHHRDGNDWPLDNYGKMRAYNEVLSFINTLEVKEVDLDAYTKVSKALSAAFMQFLDNIRPKEKMCLSNAECFDIEKAFAMMDYSKLLRYLKKYSTIKAQKGE